MKKISLLSIGSGIIVLILCELPWILALLGFTALGSRFAKLPVDILWEMMAVSAIISGIALWLYRRRALKLDS